MKIASVTFFPKKINVSGAHVSAIAFAKWCEILGIECDLIGITSSNDDKLANGRKFNGFYDKDLHEIISPEELSALNNYDAIFFSSYPMLCEIDINVIRKPFMLMGHSEYEIETFGHDAIKEFALHKKCIKITQANWFPCCLPKYLWSKEIIPKNEYGMLYAARIFEMKNPILFMKMANETLHLTQKAKMIGTCHKEELRQTLVRISNGVSLIDSRFNEHIFEREEYGLYWEVFETLRKKVKFKRLNLSATEALSNGMMPIVSTRSVPSELNGIFLNVDPLARVGADYLCDQITMYSKHKENYWEAINTKLEFSSYSYKAVQEQFIQLINKLEKANG